jgi:hypothetical protein
MIWIQSTSTVWLLIALVVAAGVGALIIKGWIIKKIMAKIKKKFRPGPKDKVKPKPKPSLTKPVNKDRVS